MKKAEITALCSGMLFALSIPISKIFLNKGVNPLCLGALTYLGAGIGLFLYNFLLTHSIKFKNPITKSDLPYTVLMVIADILAILFLFTGLKFTNSANASLLSNFEIVATAIIAFLFFNEKISKKLMIGVILIVFASIILTYEGMETFNFQIGSVMVLIAYCLWGLENNFTRMLSSKNTLEITVIKGVFAGSGSLIIALFSKCELAGLVDSILILCMGFLSYGFSVSMYIKAQRSLKATLTASYYAFNPYFAIIFSLLILKERPTTNFYVALLIMSVSLFIINKEDK